MHFFLFDSIFSLTPFLLSVEWHMISTFICDWVLCVPHRYYYCFPINVGEQSISIVIHPHHPPPTFCSVSLSLLLVFPSSYFHFYLMHRTHSRDMVHFVYFPLRQCACVRMSPNKSNVARFSSIGKCWHSDGKRMLYRIIRQVKNHRWNFLAPIRKWRRKEKWISTTTTWGHKKWHPNTVKLRKKERER